MKKKWGKLIYQIQIRKSSYLRQGEEKFLVEVDQFSHFLSGQKEETVERKSTESSTTMKEAGTTLVG